MIARMVRAACLDRTLYEEVEADPGLTGQAVAVVVLSSVAAGIAAIPHGGVRGGIDIGIVALASWYVWALLAYWIGVYLIPEPQTRADAGQLFRTIGFASAPGLVRLVGAAPGLSELAFVAGSVWMLIAMIIAIQQALDYVSVWRAIAVVLVGWLVQLIALGVVASGFPRPAAGI
jgi:hypothetical protein